MFWQEGQKLEQGHFSGWTKKTVGAEQTFLWSGILELNSNLLLEK